MNTAAPQTSIKETRITTNCDDEGHFEGYSTLMVLWPGDTYNIVRRYAPEIDLDGDGIADGKDNTGYPNLVHRIYLTSQWSSQNGSSGFPLNLKRESNFKQFVAHLENNGTGRQCIFDADGCNECIQYELDEHGDETDVCEIWDLITDQAVPMGKHCPASFYAGKECGPGSGSTQNPCTKWKGRWKPSKSGICDNVTITQTRFYQPVDSNGRRCDISQGLPSIPKPADNGDTRVVAGDRPGCPDCPDNNHDGDPDWETTWHDLRSQDHECEDSEWFRYCQHDHTKKQEHPGGPHKGTKPDVWTPATSGQTIGQLCPNQDFVEINTCGDERRTPGTKNCAVNGKCDNTVSQGCSPGTPIGYVTSTDTWSCQGLHGGTTSTGCGPVPKQGVCDNDNQNQCLVGTPIDQQSDNTWLCSGLHGGPVSPLPRCKKTGSGPPLTPQCGINCPTGNVLPVQHPLMYWQTNYAGRCRLVDSGIGLANYAPADIPCQTSQCGAAVNTCTAGVLAPQYTGITGHWLCVGADPSTGAANGAVCSTEPPNQCNTQCNTQTLHACAVEGNSYGPGFHTINLNTPYQFGRHGTFSSMNLLVTKDPRFNHRWQCGAHPTPIPPTWTGRCTVFCAQRALCGDHGPSCAVGTVEYIPGVPHNEEWHCRGASDNTTLDDDLHCHNE